MGIKSFCNRYDPIDLTPVSAGLFYIINNRTQAGEDILYRSDAVDPMRSIGPGVIGKDRFSLILIDTDTIANDGLIGIVGSA